MARDDTFPPEMTALRPPEIHALEAKGKDADDYALLVQPVRVAFALETGGAVQVNVGFTLPAEVFDAPGGKLLVPNNMRNNMKGDNDEVQTVPIPGLGKVPMTARALAINKALALGEIRLVVDKAVLSGPAWHAARERQVEVQRAQRAAAERAALARQIAEEADAAKDDE